MEGLPDSSLIIILVVMILFSAFFSASETAFSTCNKIRLKQMANRGNERAEITTETPEIRRIIENTVDSRMPKNWTI